jgi:hypothetical protein
LKDRENWVDFFSGSSLSASQSAGDNSSSAAASGHSTTKGKSFSSSSSSSSISSSSSLEDVEMSDATNFIEGRPNFTKMVELANRISSLIVESNREAVNLGGNGEVFRNIQSGMRDYQSIN